MKHITIKDVAKKLNLSISTISRAFNDKYDIREDTREQILKCAKEMGYYPNPMAKKLQQQCSYQIGVIVPEFLNSFFPEVIIGIQEITAKEGYQLLIMQSNENADQELANIKTLESSMVDGIIISLSKETKDIAYLQELLDNNFPIIFFNRTISELKATAVVFDDYKWAFFATEHLIQQGYKKIFHLTGPKDLNLCKKRKQGFIDAHRKYNLDIKPEYIIEGGFFIDDGIRVVNELIKTNNLPDAIFAVNDPSAIGAIKALKKHGFRIPEDVAIVGFTESRLSDVIDPPLTTVMQPTFEIGRTSAQLLIEQIKSKHQIEPKTIVLNGKLNIRESSLKS
ncbi:MAG: LacI family DNA-binding transcriptional regulator [Bacteroidetes bacterium]|nr:LacI family DNA-binding transcriptional regulator [Bacteroidota bacterium]